MTPDQSYVYEGESAKIAGMGKKRKKYAYKRDKSAAFVLHSSRGRLVGHSSDH